MIFFDHTILTSRTFHCKKIPLLDLPSRFCCVMVVMFWRRPHRTFRP